MTTAADPDAATVDNDDIPDVIADTMYGISLAAGGANVIMQLSRLPVGHGVAKSSVDSGRVDRHPLKRLRTTTAYLVIAMRGTEAERAALRKQIDAVHGRVRSGPADPVPYNAFDPELQLWVAACLYKGLEDVYRLVRPSLDERVLDEVVYPHAQRLGTTLQVRPEQWPADRQAFQAYWDEGVASIEMDDVTRTYLRGIAELSFLVESLGPLGSPLRPLLAPIGRFLNLGFLPAPFRDELALPWSEGQQHAFDRVIGAVAAGSTRLPRPVREFPLNLYLWDTRRRLRTGRPVL